jgi:hypothetical protein
MISARLLSLGSAAIVGVLLSACQDVGPVVATRVDFLAQPPASVANSQTLAPVTVAFLTADGEIATTATGDVQISLVTADPEARLSGTTTVTAVNGLATFSDLSLAAMAATGYKLVAKTVALDSVVSSPFEITVGPAVKLRFDPISGGQAGQFFTPVTVSVTDAGGNVVATATPTISLTADGLLLFGTTMKSAVSGRATFTDLITYRSGTTSFAASAPNLISASSNGFHVTSGTQVKLTFVTQPGNAAAGAALPPFKVTCTDAWGNWGGSLFAQIQVTVSLGNNPTGATLSGTLTSSGIMSTAEFSNVSIDKPGTGYTLVARAGGSAPNFQCVGFGPETSAPFNITP